MGLIQNLDVFNIIRNLTNRFNLVNLFSPFLTISQIEISGAREERIQSIEQSAWDQASQHRFWLLSQSHLYLFDGNQFKEKLLDQYSFNEVQIKK